MTNDKKTNVVGRQTPLRQVGLVILFAVVVLTFFPFVVQANPEDLKAAMWDHGTIVEQEKQEKPVAGIEMVRKAAMWVHGTIVEQEKPVAGIEMVRYGWGTEFKGISGVSLSNWFHIPITTPVVLNNKRPQLSKIFIFYKGMRATITNVHIYDGKKKVKEFNNLELTGDHSDGIDKSNSWDISPHITIRYGLGISVRVEFFGDPDISGGSSFLFTAAGADFIQP